MSQVTGQDLVSTRKRRRAKERWREKTSKTVHSVV